MRKYSACGLWRPAVPANVGFWLRPKDLTQNGGREQHGQGHAVARHKMARRRNRPVAFGPIAVMAARAALVVANGEVGRLDKGRRVGAGAGNPSASRGSSHGPFTWRHGRGSNASSPARAGSAWQTQDNEKLERFHLHAERHSTVRWGPCSETDAVRHIKTRLGQAASFRWPSCAASSNICSVTPLRYTGSAYPFGDRGARAQAGS